MNEELAMNTGNGSHGDIHHAEGNIAAAKVRLVELESLVGNLYLAKDIVSKPASGEQSAYTTKQQ
jgi:hypothetical protein